MPEIKFKEMSLLVDGKVLEIKKPSKMNFELNKALEDPLQFVSFTKDPQSFVKNYDLFIDKDISEQLSKKLLGVPSIEVLRRSFEKSGATGWAIAAGSYSIASSKIAVAF